MSPDRVEVNVVADRSQGIAILDGDARKAALKHMAPLVPEAIEADGEGALQPVHAGGQVRARGGDSQVKVVGHECPSVDAPARFLAGLVEATEERAFGAGGSKNRAAVVTAVDHVIGRVFGFEPQGAGHAAILQAQGRSATTQL